MVDASAIWTAAATILGDLEGIVSLFVSLGLVFILGDWLLGRQAPNVSDGGGPGSGVRGRKRAKGKNLGPLPTFRNEDYHTTDSWSDLEDHARKVNGWDGEGG